MVFGTTNEICLRAWRLRQLQVLSLSRASLAVRQLNRIPILTGSDQLRLYALHGFSVLGSNLQRFSSLANWLLL
jgi:hypothetical protein